MAQPTTKLPVKTETSGSQTPAIHHPFDTLRREMDRLFDDFDLGFWRAPFGRAFDVHPLLARDNGFVAVPAVDVAETDRAYELTAELPGMDEKNIDVKLANGVLTIKGEKKEKKEEKQKDYYLSERRFGAFERSFRVPEGVDTNKIAARFSKGVLTISLPKTIEAQKAEKKIAVKSA